MNGPYAVGKFWAVKFLLRLEDPTRESWWVDAVETHEEFTTDFAGQAITSPLVRSLLKLKQQPYAIRSIVSLTRERERFTTGDWVLVEQAEVRVIVRIRSMAQCLFHGEEDIVNSFIRIWCDCVVEPHIGTSGELWATPKSTGETLIALEEVHLKSVTRNSHESHDVYI